MTLGTVLMLVAVAMVVAFTLAGMAFSQLNLEARTHNLRLARLAAESAIANAIDQLLATKMQFGMKALPTDLVRKVYAGGSVGLVTFVPGTVEQHIPIPLSTHNWLPQGAPSTKLGYGGRVVPRDAVQLVGTGLYGGVVRSVEVVLHIPNFPFAVAAQGRLTTQSALIAGLPSGGSLPLAGDGSFKGDPGKLLGGDVVSNSGDSSALTLDVSTHVTGDAQAVGGINVTGASQVDGEVRPHEDTVNIPHLNVADYDPHNNQFTQFLPGALDNPTLAGYAYQAGDLVVDGDLKLENGLLFVTGNLHVSGGLVGTGAVFVEGATTVTGTTNLKESDSVALVSQGDVNLIGSDRGRNFLQGLVYTRGNFMAQHITLVGTFVQDSPAGIAGTAVVDDANLIHSATHAVTYDFVSRDFVANAGGNLYVKGGAAAGSPGAPSFAAVDNQMKTIQESTQDQPAQAALNQQQGLVQPPTADSIAVDSGDYNQDHVMLGISQRNQQYILTLRWEGRRTDNGLPYFPPARNLLPGSPWTSYPTDTMPGRVISILEFSGPAVPASGSIDISAFSDVINEVANSQAAHIAWWGHGDSVAAFKSFLTTYVTWAIAPLAHSQQPVANFRYDPNDYLTLADKMRVLLYKDVP